MALGSEKEIFALLDDTKKSYEQKAEDESVHCAMGVAYFSGLQWHVPGRRIGERYLNSDGRLALNYNPSSPQIRVMDNFTTQFTQLTEASTFPVTLPVQVKPFDHDITTGANELAQIVRQVIEREKPFWRADQAARHANFMSSITGGWLIVVELARETADVDGRTIGDWTLRWRTCPATDLILEVHREDVDLRDHDLVILKQIWTLPKLRRMYGIEIDPNDATPIKDLAEQYLKANRISGNRLYRDYREHSEKPGVCVYQMHHKSDPMSGRFDQMCVVMEGNPGGEYRSKTLLNSDDMESPFGFDGLPMALVNYFKRVGSPIGNGATHQMMSDQDRQNLSATLYTLGLAHSAVPTWLIDTRVVSRDQFSGTIGNGIGSPIFYRGRPTNEAAQPPTSIRTADPSPAHLQIMDRIPEQARNKVHRSALHMGIGKSHVPDTTTERLLDESGKVLDEVVETHASIYADLYRVSIGTVRKAIDTGAPTMLRRWSENGFTAEHLMVFKRMDAHRFGLEINVPREAVRMRSSLEKERNIVSAVSLNNPLITNHEARYALAMDAQSPITQADNRVIQFAQRSAERVLAGQEWEPMPEIDHDIVLYVFRQALYSYDGEDRDAKARLIRAIKAQSSVRNDELTAAQTIQNGGQPPGPVQSGVDLSGLTAEMEMNAA